MIPFFKPYGLEQSTEYMQDALNKSYVAGDGGYTARCCNWIEDRLRCNKVLMTTSCTHALELACQSLNLMAGDEIIIPSFTYPSTANAVLLAGGTLVYCEVEEEHFTMDPDRLEQHITDKTKAIIPVHYGGIACDMDRIMAIARRYDLIVIEDAAQGFLSEYKGQALGTIADFGCFSFHGTKDMVSGEGGALLVNNPDFIDVTVRFRQKGTNQAAFKKGLVPHYEWVGKGSSYSPSDLLMALLYGQLGLAVEILSMKTNRFDIYSRFFISRRFKQLKSFSRTKEETRGNGHLFYIEFYHITEAQRFIRHMSEAGISTYTHFIPLHESQMGQAFIRENNMFAVEKGLGKRLVRLPLYAELTSEEQEKVMSEVDRYMCGA